MIRTAVAVLFVIQMLMPLAAMAQEKVSKSPFDYSLRHYGLLLSFALLGGFVSWWGKVKAGDIPKWSMSHLIGELSTSAFAGLICFWLCEYMNLPSLLTAALTGVSGHMGTRAITLFEEAMARRFGATGANSNNKS